MPKPSPRAILTALLVAASLAPLVAPAGSLPAALRAAPPATGGRQAPLAQLADPGTSVQPVASAEPAPNSTAPATEENATIQRTAVPAKADPADYGANADGAYWEDGTPRGRVYEIAAGATITTHLHGVVLTATEAVYVNGTIDVAGLGAPENESGYESNRYNDLQLLRGYGPPTMDGREPLLYGSGGQGCQGQGGGYVVIHAPTIQVAGTIDASSTGCGVGGIVILEANTIDVTGKISANLVIRRGWA